MNIIDTEVHGFIFQYRRASIATATKLYILRSYYSTSLMCKLTYLYVVESSLKIPKSHQVKLTPVSLEFYNYLHIIRSPFEVQQWG